MCIKSSLKIRSLWSIFTSDEKDKLANLHFYWSIKKISDVFIKRYVLGNGKKRSWKKNSLVFKNIKLNFLASLKWSVVNIKIQFYKRANLKKLFVSSLWVAKMSHTRVDGKIFLYGISMVAPSCVNRKYKFSFFIQTFYTVSKKATIKRLF